jgi:hypothetical protein
MAGASIRFDVDGMKLTNQWAARGLATLGLAMLVVWLAGCVTPPSARKDLLKFLEAGHPTREEVILELGQPSGTFERERILTYRIGQLGEEGYYIVSPKVVMPNQAPTWQSVSYSLVLVFDEQGRLRTHRLVRVD